MASEIPCIPVAFPCEFGASLRATGRLQLRSGVMAAPGAGGGAARILEPGMTCWRVAQANRAAVLIDGASYYGALLPALHRARSAITILGWDFDARIRLDPTDPATELHQLLPSLVDRHPTLEIFVLIWDVSLLFGPSRPLGELLDRDWQQHPRIHFRFDGQHPTGACHHEKIVCVDDKLAFVGGIDLTVKRWDTSEHRPEMPERRDPEGDPYDPVHDLQMAVDGEAAAAIAELTRARWAEATGEILPPCENTGGDPWPKALAPGFTDLPVAIARTRPATGDRPGVKEIAALNEAALTAARRSVYLEAQYLSSPAIADQLVELLQRADPPEIVLVIWHEAIGWLERFLMGSNRERLLRRLADADRQGRLRAYWLGVPGQPEREINLHAKLMIIDDIFLRVGSSNLNNRSLGFDTECDLAIEAQDRATAEAIARLRDTLLAEHLGRPVQEVAQAASTHGLIGAIERLNHGDRRLVPFRIEPDSGSKEPIPGTPLLDPTEPPDLDYVGRHLRAALWPRRNA